MTVKELYEWATENKAEDLEIEIQYRDGGGFYCGTDIDVSPAIERSEYSDNKVVLI